MQAVAALCHFCETHGPRIVMVTQPVRDLTLLDQNSQIDEYGEYGSYSAECLIDEWRKTVFEDDPRCAACSSFQGDLGFSTSDTVSHFNYISSQVPVNERVYHLMKNACLRSISCEVSGTVEFPKHNEKSFLEGRSISLDIRNNSPKQRNEDSSDAESNGIVLFGDDYNGYTLAHTFRLRDAKARGFYRCFSLVIVSMDKFLLTSNYDYFVSAMSSIISKLQEQAFNVYRKECNSGSIDLASPALLLKNSTLPNYFLKSSKVTNLELDTSRPLSDIVGDTDVFLKLHRQLTILLRTHSRLHLESVLEGVPSQDLLVRSELDPSEAAEVRTEAETCTQYYALLRIARMQQIAKKLEELGKGPTRLLTAFITHIVHGSKVIVKCDDVSFTKQFLLSLFDLIPVGCARFAYRKNYEFGNKYSLFGCPASIEIPLEIKDAFIIDLAVEPEMEEIHKVCKQVLSSDDETSPPTSLLRLSSPCAEEIIMTGDFHMRSQTVTSIVDKAQKEYLRCNLRIERLPENLSTEMPTIVKRYCELLLDEDIPLRALEAVIKDTREHWLKRAKLIYQIRSQKPEIDMNSVLRIVRCTTNDLAMLNFWQSGLSKAYKEHVQHEIEFSQKWKKVNTSEKSHNFAT